MGNKNKPVKIYCTIKFPHQQDDSPTIFARNSKSYTFLVTHGPGFALGNFTTYSSTTGSLPGNAAVALSPDVVDHLLCPPPGKIPRFGWPEELEDQASTNDVLSVENLGAGAASGLIYRTNVITPLELDQDHPFLSVGIINSEGGNFDDYAARYWAGQTWDLSSFVVAAHNDGLLSLQGVDVTVYQIRYDGQDSFNNVTRCRDGDAVITLERVIRSLDEPPKNNNYTADDVPQITCEAYHHLDQDIAQAQRKTTVVASVLGSCLAVAVLVILALLRRAVVVARRQREAAPEEKAPPPASSP